MLALFLLAELEFGIHTESQETEGLCPCDSQSVGVWHTVLGCEDTPDCG